VLLKQGCRILSRVFQIIQSLNLNYGKALIWQILVSQASRRQFPDSWKVLRSLQINKSWILSWLSGRPSEASRRPSVWKDFEQLSIDCMICSEDRATSSGLYLVFEKILNYATDTDWWRQLATVWTLGQHRPDAVLNKATREAHYGSRLHVAVWTLYVFVRMPPRELWISVVLSLQKPINRGL
jgi:hypothetical protein